jgi:hypothetical protein
MANWSELTLMGFYGGDISDYESTNKLEDGTEVVVFGYYPQNDDIQYFCKYSMRYNHPSRRFEPVSLKIQNSSKYLKYTVEEIEAFVIKSGVREENIF